MPMISYIYAGFLGAVVCIAFPPVGFWPFAWGVFSAFAYLISRPHRTTVQVGLLSLCFSLLMNIGMQNGIASATLNVFSGSAWIPASITAIFYVIVALPFVLAMVVWKVITSYFLNERFGSSSWAKFVLLCTIFCLWDAYNPQPFPWSPFMAAGSNDTLLSSVGVLKTVGWSGLFYAQILAIAMVIERHLRPNQKVLAILAIFFIPLVIPYGLGIKNRSILESRYSQVQPVLLVQDNIQSDERPTTSPIKPSGHETELRKKLIADVLENANGVPLSNGVGKPELWIFWSETVFNLINFNGGTSLETLVEHLAGLPGLHLIGVGEIEESQSGGELQIQHFNSVALLSGRWGYIAHNRKQRLFPFGEYLPFPFNRPWLSRQIGDFRFNQSPGKTVVPLVHPNSSGPVFIPLVCLEAIMADYIDFFLQQTVELYKGRDTILVIPSSDQYFIGTNIPPIHALLVRWQVARVGLSAVRSTTSGITQIIAPWGEALATAPTQVRTFLTGNLPVTRVTIN